MVGLMGPRSQGRLRFLMEADSISSRATRHGASLSWPARILHSGTFALLVSVVLHAAVFAGLHMIVFRQGDELRRVIIPEARLAPDAEPTELTPPEHIELTDKPTTEVEPLAVPELSHMPMISTDLSSQIMGICRAGQNKAY